MKKKFTIQERHELYKTIHRKIKEGYYPINCAGFCDRMALDLYGNGTRFDMINKTLFPEYWLFKPSLTRNCYWFGSAWASTTKGENEQHRLVALEFCIAMTENEI